MKTLFQPFSGFLEAQVTAASPQFSGTFLTFDLQLLSRFSGVAQSKCQDRYLWVRLASKPLVSSSSLNSMPGASASLMSSFRRRRTATPAPPADGRRPRRLASRCGYTTSTVTPDGFTVFRASFFSCFTHNQLRLPNFLFKSSQTMNILKRFSSIQ